MPSSLGAPLRVERLEPRGTCEIFLQPHPGLEGRRSGRVSWFRNDASVGARAPFCRSDWQTATAGQLGLWRISSIPRSCRCAQLFSSYKAFLIRSEEHTSELQ